MRLTRSTRRTLYRYALAALLMIALASMYSHFSPSNFRAAEDSLLSGKVVASDGHPLAGVPVRAHRQNSNMAVTVYTNNSGDYSFPGWSDLSAGVHSISIDLPDFEPARRETVTLVSGKTSRADFSLQPREPSIADATASEIVAALPGTNEQKHLFIQCDNCHSLQFALKTPRTKEGWLQIIRRMAGERAVSRETPGTRAFGQKKYVEPLAEYLASIRGPGSSDQIPFQLRPRPTGDAATRLVVTEYDIPRAGKADLSILRGDRRYVWPHDIILEPKGPYAYYTDHFSYNLGRLDRRTGEAKEFPYKVLQGMGREGGIIAEGQGRAGNPGGGAHDLAFDPDGNVVFGMGGGTIRFNPRTEEFTPWASGSNMFGMGPGGNVWYLDKGLFKLDLKTGEVKHYTVPDGTDDDTYDMETDPHGRSIMNLYRLGKIGLFDPETERFTAYPTPTPGSGPRRGDMDAQGREWVGLYWAGRIAVFDPNKPEAIKEYPLIPGNEAYTPPFPSPYTVAVDDKNQIVWTNDFNSSRIYRIDMKTGQSTEFFTPSAYEIRDLTVDKYAARPTVWIPGYRPQSRMVKVQVR